jgi:hydroxymethylpyrimidine pyrophosphatase-like HAD family hydrolase
VSEDERRAGGGHTDRSIDAVHKLRESGVKFALTSGRPPRGMQMLIEPLALDTPIAAFNGGLLVDLDVSVLAQQVIPEDLVAPIVAMLDVSGLDVWIYRGAEWLIRDLKAPHVARESFIVQFEPTRVASLEGLTEDVAKISSCPRSTESRPSRSPRSETCRTTS